MHPAGELLADVDAAPRHRHGRGGNKAIGHHRHDTVAPPDQPAWEQVGLLGANLGQGAHVAAVLRDQHGAVGFKSHVRRGGEPVGIDGGLAEVQSVAVAVVVLQTQDPGTAGGEGKTQ